jgi:hypothetical protein
MEIKQLRRFLMVVERGSLAAAAPVLGLTQQALGASIAKLVGQGSRGNYYRHELRRAAYSARQEHARRG